MNKELGPHGPQLLVNPPGQTSRADDAFDDSLRTSYLFTKDTTRRADGETSLSASNGLDAAEGGMSSGSYSAFVFIGSIVSRMEQREWAGR